MSRVLLLMLMLLAGLAHAGTQCRQHLVTPTQWMAATRSALAVARQLDRHDQPVALIARNGTDLSRHGIRYSHVGFALRDHPDGRWTIVHLLNRCDADNSALFAEGLINFFADDMVSYDSRLVWLNTERSKALLRLLNSEQIHQLHQPHYNLIAHPNSRRFQNSTSWALEVLAASAIGRDRVDRDAAQALAHALDYRPFWIHIPYSKRIAGGLFSANTHFTDHSVAARLSGEYAVVTVESIFEWLRANGWASEESEVEAEPE